jgi:hypothetical protein
MEGLVGAEHVTEGWHVAEALWHLRCRSEQRMAMTCSKRKGRFCLFCGIEGGSYEGDRVQLIRLLRSCIACMRIE